MTILTIREHPYKLSLVMALAVAVLFNICFLLFSVYGDYIISNYKSENNIEETRMPPPDRKEAPGMKPEMMEHPKMDGRMNPEMERPQHRMEEKHPGIQPSIFFGNLVSHFLFTFMLFAICFSILFKGKYAEWKKMTFVTVACLMWIMAYGYLSARFIAFGGPEGPGKIHMIRAMTTISLFLGLMVFTSSLIIYYVRKWHEAALENEALRTLNYSSQYEALKSKLDPHFLFNALNTLSGLIAIESKQTEEYVQKLSSIFRTTLSHEDVSALEDEVDFAKAYGDLMTIRYEKSLQIVYDIPEEMMDRKIVSFGIQTLIENAIKHNTITLRKPLEISVRYNDNYIVVSNQIHPRKETEQSNGLGLKLLSERCIALLGKDIIIENVNEVFTVKIPLG